MISAMKRLLNKTDNLVNENGGGSNSNWNTPPGVQKLDKELQRKFARGVNYNMKVVIKGDAQVGKTSLFCRLRGKGFQEDYEPTNTLNVTSIDWNYKTTDDIVKLDLWEAIDVSSKKMINYVDLKPEDNARNGLDTEVKIASQENKLDPSISSGRTTSIMTSNTTSKNRNGENSLPASVQQSLTEISENYDVYSGAHAVLLMMDMTKSWTFKYVLTELPKIPNHIPVLVIANHRDQGHHRTVTSDQVQSFINGLDREPCDGLVMYTEASMRNGFGLKLIEKFLNIPFLRLQEASLLKQLEINRSEYMSTREELQVMQESSGPDYERYIELETIRRRQQADAMSPVNCGIKQMDESTRDMIRNSTVSNKTVYTGSSSVTSIESNNNSDKISQAQTLASQKFVNDRLTSIVIGAKNPLPSTKAMSTINKSSFDQAQQVNSTNSSPETPNSPDNQKGETDSEEEDEQARSNPLVADYQSDIDADDK